MLVLKPVSYKTWFLNFFPSRRNFSGSGIIVVAASIMAVVVVVLVLVEVVAVVVVVLVIIEVAAAVVAIVTVVRRVKQKG